VKLKRPQPAVASGLDAKLKGQHRSNCEASAARWGTLSGDDALPGTYIGGWHEYEAASVAPQNAPYGTDRLLLRSRAPLLSEELCASLIVLMEAHGAANGFDARYPVTGFTREVNVADIPGWYSSRRPCARRCCRRPRWSSLARAGRRRCA